MREKAVRCAPCRLMSPLLTGLPSDQADVHKTVACRLIELHKYVPSARPPLANAQSGNVQPLPQPLLRQHLCGDALPLHGFTC